MYRVLIANLRPAVEVPVIDLEGRTVKNIQLPDIFRVPVRIDIIRRAHHSAQSASKQPQGRDPLAGKRRVGESWGAGYSVARVPRLDNGRAVFAPMTRGGRRTHPPRVDKVIVEEVNKKERILAIVSALSATAVRDFVVSRGHIVPDNISLPVVVIDDLEDISRAGEASDFLVRTWLWLDVERSAERTRIRAGKGKRRGRRYVEPKSLLIVLSSPDAQAFKAFRNFPGVDVAFPGNLGIIHLAPGGVPGRLMVISESALRGLESKYSVYAL
jgi:large subunit ribosomal protein L4e